MRDRRNALAANLIVATTFFTGFSGLVYEVTWHRYLANLVGSHAQAAALILAVFLGFLGVGYKLFGGASKDRSPRTLLKLYAALEFAIGLYAAVFPQIFEGVSAVAWSGGLLGLGFARDFALSVLLLALPTTAMGATLPLLTQGLGRGLRDASTLHARIYGLNAAGAFVGTLAAAFFLIPEWGLPLTMYAMSCINILAGLLLGATASMFDAETTTAPEAKVVTLRSGGEQLSMRAAAVNAFLAGFYSIAIQTIMVRLTGSTMGASDNAFAMVVAVYILMLSLGSLGLRMPRRAPASALLRNQVFVVIGLTLAFATIPYWPYAHHLIRTSFAQTLPGLWVYQVVSFLTLAVVLAFPVGAMGRTMPLIFNAAKSRMTDVGSDIGKLYALNTAGCVFGAVVGGYLMLHLISLDTLFRGMIVLAAIGAVVVFVGKGGVEMPRLARVAAAAVATAIVLAAWPRWQNERFAIGLWRETALTPSWRDGAGAVADDLLAGGTLSYFRDDPNTTVAVYEAPKERTGGELVRSILVNGKSDGKTSGLDVATMKLASHLPALFAGARPQAAIIGFGTGMSAGSMSLYEHITKMHLIEISDGVREAAPLFDFANENMSKSPKVEWHMGDAFRVLPALDKNLGIIMSEPSNPWLAGVERLFSQDFYRMAQGHLADDGIFVQWIQTYNLSLASIGMVLNTVGSVFPETHTFYGGPNDLIIMASKRRLDAAAFAEAARRFESPTIKRDLASMGIDRFEALIGREILVGPAAFGDAGLQMLDFPKLSHQAAMEQFLEKGQGAAFLGQERQVRPWAARFGKELLLTRVFEPSAPDFPERLKAALPGLCGGTALSVGGQSTKPRVCMSAYARLMSAGTLEPTSELEASIKEQLGKFLGTGALPDDPRTRALTALQTFDFLDSPFNRLSPDRLVELTAACRPGGASPDRDCHVRLVEVLASTGNFEHAKKAFADLPDDFARAKTAPTMMAAMAAAQPDPAPTAH